MKAPLLALALAALSGCCTCLSPPDDDVFERAPAAQPGDVPESEARPDPEPEHEDPGPEHGDTESGEALSCGWFYEVAYACADLPDAPVEPCLEEEGALCDGRLDGAGLVQMVVGSNFGCALFDSGRVKCWGENRYGTLGLGHDAPRGRSAAEQGNALRYVDLGDAAHAVALAAGPTHVCALLASGRVKCWGANTDGQLGLGDTAHRGDHRGEMGDRLPFVDLGHQRVVQLTAGSERTCALMADGSAHCWGENLWGYLGIGVRFGNRADGPNEMGPGMAPIDLGAECAPVASLHAGGRSTCALFEDGRVKCWGSNTHGELGLGHDEDIGDESDEMGTGLPYVDLGGGGRVRTLAVGGRHACAVLEEGGLKCWGEGYGGMMGQPMNASDGLGDAPGEMGEALPYVDLGRDDDPVQLAAGFDATCALFADGWIKCWGVNFLGQLGNGDDESRGDDVGEMGVALPYVELDRPAVEIVGRSQGFCARTDDDAVHCWGAAGAQGVINFGD